MTIEPLLNSNNAADIPSRRLYQVIKRLHRSSFEVTVGGRGHDLGSRDIGRLLRGVASLTTSSSGTEMLDWPIVPERVLTFTRPD